MATSLNEFEAPFDEDMGSASDEESGDSSESGSDDDDDDGEESEDEENEEECDANENDTNMSIMISDEDSERESCPICLNRFVGQDLGTPESCEHTFCFECIQEWSKNINTCPIDRTEFNYIYLRTVPGGDVIKKVKVKVLPKEAEETLQESVTLCEVCQSGDREDRLLLCDGCDLAYHCECLDPPLFYIPIEEWFCPSCSGVFSNKAVAGPSHSRVRRVIPRTRASEAVRSRVQNLRTGPSSAPRSTSNHSRVSKASTSAPKKRRRRTYRRAIKKVVNLARTKKSQSDAGKGKLAARGTTVLVTYRKGRRRKRRSTKRRSKKSMASSKALPVPSAQHRIAKRLGISKSHSPMPQVKTSGIRLGSGSRGDRMPSHSLFGNKNQLMDFSENFHEDINAPSTSRSVPIGRTSVDNSSSNSSVNILDSIFAGYKLLHEKSDNIVIKTDGSLVLKESKANVKTLDSTKKSESTHSSRTPMSIALAKEGVKSLTPVSGKKSSSLPKQKIDKTSKEKNIQLSGQSKLCSEKQSSKMRVSNKLSITKNSSKNSSEKSTNDEETFSNEEKCRKSTLSTWKIPRKSEVKPKEKEKCTSVEVENLTHGFECDIPSDWESELSNQSKRGDKTLKTLNAVKKENAGIKYSPRSKGSNIGSSLKSNNLIKECSYSSENLISASKKDLSTKNLPTMHIKKEIVSDEETGSNSQCENAQTVHIKQEILSDEDTNVDYWVTSGANKNNKEQKAVGNKLAANIKKDFNDSECETDASRNSRFANDQSISPNINDVSDNSDNSDASENEDTDFDASQSIIDSAPNDSSYLSQHRKGKSQIPSMKIKEEISSDSEEFSQSLVSNLESSSQYKSNNSGLLSNPNMLRSSKLPISNLPEDDLPCTQVASYSVANDRMSLNDTANYNASHLSHSTGELPDTQLLSQHVSPLHDKRTDHNVFRNEENAPVAAFDDLLSTEMNNESDSDTSNNDSQNSEDELPQTQLNPVPYKSLSDSEDISSNPIQNDKSSKNITDYESSPHSDEELPPIECNNTSEIPDEYMFHNSNQLNSSLNRETRDLPETRVSALVNNLSSCVSQNLNPTSKMNSHLPEITKKASTSSSQPAAQNLNSTSKEAPQFRKPTEVDMVSKVLSATQVFNAVPGIANIFDSQALVSECESLAATELFDAASDIAEAHRQISMLSSESKFPETQMFDVTSEITHIPDTQASVLADEFSLPATQMFTATVEPSVISSKINANSSDNLASPCLSDQAKDKEGNISMNDIISNIKQIVSTLSRHPNDFNFKSNQDKTDITPADCDNVSENNTDPDNPEIDTSADAEDAANIGDQINASLENPENSESSDSESEEISPEKLKELLSKSAKIESPKRVGVHKHLPQVITVKPVKELVKPKLPYRRTFSFDEVAKLEKPTLGKSHNFDKTKVGEARTLENSDNNSSDIDQDNIIATQNVEIDKNDEMQEPEMNMTECSSKRTSLNNVGLNNESIRNAIDKLFTMDFEKSTIETTELEDVIPATQVATWPQNEFGDLPETQIANSGNASDRKQIFLSSKSKIEKVGTHPKKMNVPVALENIKNEIMRLTKNYSLPGTQICNFRDENNFIVSPLKIKKEIFLEDIEENQMHQKVKSEIISSNSDEINLPLTQACDFSKENRSIEPCIKIKKEVISLSDSDEGNLPATQFCDLKKEINFTKPHTKIEKEISLLDSDEISLSTQILSFNKINSSKSSSNSRIVISDYENHNEAEASKSSGDLHNLPATQVFKVPIGYSNKTFELATAKRKSKDHKDNSGCSLDVNIRNKNQSVVKKHHDVLDCSTDISKQKKSSNDSYSYLDKEYSNQDRSIKISKPGEFDHIRRENVSNDYNRGSKRSCEQEMSCKEPKKFKNDSSSSEMLKQKSEQSNRKDNTKSASFSDDRRTFSVEKSSKSLKNSISHENIKLKEIAGKTQTVAIKQEKVYPYFENMTSITKNKDSPASQKIINVHSKSVDQFEDNSLPPTQAVDFDFFEDNSLPATQAVNFDHITARNVAPSDISKNSRNKQIEQKSSSQVQREVLSDDEISIIEVKAPATLRVNEEIISIDDDDDDNDDDDAIIVPQVNTLNPKNIKNVSVQSEKNVEECRQSMKTEDILETKKKTSKSGNSGIKISSNDVKKDKKLADSSFLKEKHKSKIYERTKNKECKSRLEDVKKGKISNDVSIFTNEKHKEHNDLLKSKTKNKHHERIGNDTICKISTDASILTKEKQKEHNNNLLKLKLKKKGENNDSNIVNKSNYSKEPTTFLKGENKHERKENNKLKSKGIDLKNKSKQSNKKTVSDSTNDIQVHEVSNSSNLQNEKLVRSSSEKENENSLKKKHNIDEVIITLKSSNKRPHKPDEFSDSRKKSRCESFSSDISSELNTSREGETNPNVKLQPTLDCDDSTSNSTVKSPLPYVIREARKICRKQDLKEEIAIEVKLVLKPFFSTGLISKEDYKDIMRRAVPKIFVNCHNCIHPEKIRKLVLSYVSLLNKS